MAIKYSYATQALIDEIGNAIYGGKWADFKKSAPELIPCQYTGILPSSGNMKPDKSWEGVRTVRRNGRVEQEFFGGFAVLKDRKGRCFIPKTPGNERRLAEQKDSKRQVYATQVVPGSNPVRTQRVRRWETVPPLYSRLEGETLMPESVNDYIKQQIAAGLAAAGIKPAAALPADEVVQDEVAPVVAPAGIVDLKENGQPAAPAVGGGHEATPPAEAPQPANRGGRPRKIIEPVAVGAGANADFGDDF